VEGEVFPEEPLPTAVRALTLALLLGAGALLSRGPGRLGIPLPLLFIGLGMAAGEDGLGGIRFDDYGLAFRIGTIALALILFDGGLNTSPRVVRANIWPALTLATLGVAGTAALLAVFGRAAGLPWPHALLLGAVTSSTDAAAVFALRRQSGIRLEQRVGGTLELESGLNDPMAVLLTMALTRAIVEPGAMGLQSASFAVLQLGVGLLIGLAVGFGGRWVLKFARPFVGGLHPVLTLSLALLAFSGATLLQGSGFLAVFVAGVALGSGRMPYRAGILRVHDFLAWLSQVTMFVVFGLLVFPSQLPGVALRGLLLAVALAFVARPVSVFLCVAAFGFSLREHIYLGWVGLRGAVPIILAIFPVLAGVQDARRLFHVVFFVVLVSVLLQGGSLRWLTRRLKLEAGEPPPPPAALEITSTRLLEGEIMGFHIARASAVCGATMAELPFPPGAAAMLVIRGDQLVAPRGPTRLEPGDHVYVFCRPEDRAFLQLLFGQEQ
jgi:cell volume regulation protein A